jgi:acetyl-CoA C-acetyltransferase
LFKCFIFLSGIPVNVPATTINKVCSSGLKSIMYGAMGIGMGLNNVVVTGGFESMSNVPYYIMNHRKGNSFGNEPLLDGLAYDGLTDPYNNIAMGLCAEKTVNDLKIDRAVQDEYCILSYERAIASIKSGKFVNEIVPVKISDKETVRLL